MHHFWESIIEPAFAALRPTTIVEIGCLHGAHTKKILPYCSKEHTMLHVIDPLLPTDTKAWQAEYGDLLVFHHDISLNALPIIERYDAVLIDGDHNWYTVFHELKIIEEYAQRAGKWPVIFLHDTIWPYGRRDMYHDPECIPKEMRHPFVYGGLIPKNPAPQGSKGLNASFANAIPEGGDRNGVLTAIEDFLKQTTQSLHFQNIPGGSGLGILAAQVALEKNPAFASFFLSLHINPPILQCIETMEEERIRTVISAKSRAGQLRKAREEWERLQRELRGELRAERERLQGELACITRTRSWRWTAPMRRAEQYVHSRSDRLFYTIFSLLKKGWKRCGAPCPHFVRYVRYHWFRFWPVQGALQLPTEGEQSSFASSHTTLSWKRRLFTPLKTGSIPLIKRCVPDIIIPTHNNTDYTRQCLMAIRNHTSHYRIIWVDNGSTSKSVALVEEELATMPHIALKHPMRLGFVKATNMGIAASSSEAVILLNNDTKVSAGWLDALLEPFDHDPTIGITGPVTDARGSWQGHVARGEGYRLVQGMVAFFCVAILHEVIEQVGYLSEEFAEGFADDNDYCVRARKAGWHIALAQNSFVRHAHRTTFRAIHGQQKVDTMIQEAMARFRSKQP